MRNSMLLQMGDIIRCWWPNDELGRIPGNKLRPVVFLGYTEKNGTSHIVVAYGTSQVNTYQARNGGDLIIRCRDDSKSLLCSDTLFDFNYLHCLPLNNIFFCTEKVSPLPVSRLREVAVCMHAARVDRALQRFGVKI